MGRNGTGGSGVPSSTPRWNASCDGTLGGCYVFDGIDDHINASRVISSQNFTIEAWVNYKPTAFDGSSKAFFYQGTGSGDLGTFIGEYAGGACFYTNSAGFCAGASYWIKDTWLHVVGVAEGSGFNLTLYVNGTVVATGVGGGVPTNNPASVGRWYDYSVTTLRYTNASIADLKIYNFSMNASQVRANFISGLRRKNLLETIEARTTIKNENWSACITPNDGLEDGDTKCTIGLIVTNSPPNFTGAPDNTTNEDTTPQNFFYNFSDFSSDADNDNLTFVIENQTNSTLINCVIFGRVYLNCTTPLANTTGVTNITINVTDGDDVVRDSFLVTVVSVNDAPQHTTPIINATTANNLSIDNITVFNQSTTDVDGDAVTNIINWYRRPDAPLLFGVYTFDTNFTLAADGSIIKDYSFYQVNLSLGEAQVQSYAPRWNASCLVSGGCYEFDGINDSLQSATTLATYHNTSSLTFEAWVRPASSAQNDNARIISLGTSTYRYELLADINVFQKYDLTNSISFCGGQQSDPTPFAPGNWYHVVATFGTNGTSALYVNGTAVVSANANDCKVNFTRATSGLTELTVGEYLGGGTFYFNGSIDEVRIYNISLSQSEISDIYNGILLSPPIEKKKSFWEKFLDLFKF